MQKPVQARLDLLTDEVRRHDDLYHAKGEPEIPDRDYDALKTELTTLEEDHPELADPGSPTTTVGAPPASGLPTTDHPVPMLSLANAFDEDQFRTWHARMANALGTDDFPVAIEPKLDGLAVRIEYRDCQLAMAATRGDGNQGEDITDAVSSAYALPQTIDDMRTLHLRGEIYIPKAAFAEINERRDRDGLQLFANARNAAAGAVRSSDAQEARNRRVAVCIYHAEFHHPLHSMNIDAAHLRALPTPAEATLAKSADDCVVAYHRMLGQKEAMVYETDGLVFKLDRLSDRDILGETSHEPRWAIAWKWPPENAETRLIDISISHGRFGKLTPVAHLEPVQIGGVTIQSASLHNLSDMQRKDIRPGEKVIIQRAGEVIPQVTGPANTDPNRRVPKFEMPQTCPACSGPVTAEPGLTAHWCVNEECPARLPEQLQHFVSKRAMNIEHLGSHWCHALIEAGLVCQNPADIYAVTKNQLTTINRMGARNADRILNQIKKSKNQPLDRVLYSLGIYRLGRTVSQLLAKKCATAADAATLSEASLAAMDGIGPVIAREVSRGLKSDRVKTMLQKLEAAGVNTRAPAGEPNPDKEKRATMEPNPNFQDKVFVVTGKLATGTRGEVESFIQQNGGSTASSVTKATSVLVVGEKPGSKLQKAQSLGVRIISESELMRMAA